MSSSERDVARFLAEMHQRMGALEANEIRRGGSRTRAGEAEAREKSLEQTWERKVRFRRSPSWGTAAAELSARFEKDGARNCRIGELSQKALAKIAKTSREFHEAAGNC